LEKDLSEVTRMNENLESELPHYYNNGRAPLYDPNEMEAFAPALFTQILKSILNTGMSKDRQDIQRKRTVALMHIQ